MAALRPGFTTSDLLTILNQSIINFPTNSAEIRAVGKTLLQHAAAAFKQLPSGTVIEIAGYTDNTGDPAANLQLSEQRADNVMAELVKLGIDPSRMTSKGYGAEDPIADNSTEEGRQKNRRISLRVTDKQASAA